MKEVQEKLLPRVWWCPPILLIYPHEWGIEGVEIEHGQSAEVLSLT